MMKCPIGFAEATGAVTKLRNLFWVLQLVVPRNLTSPCEKLSRKNGIVLSWRDCTFCLCKQGHDGHFATYVCWVEQVSYRGLVITCAECTEKCVAWKWIVPAFM